MKAYNFSFVITQDGDGYYMASVPQLPGCHTQAKSLSTLNKRLGEAIELYLEVEDKKKETIIPSKFIGVQQIEVHV